jgi:hypothetical protein
MDCPVNYRSGNAPPQQDILGTLLQSVWAGHKRYAHVTTVRSGSVLPGRLPAVPLTHQWQCFCECDAGTVPDPTSKTSNVQTKIDCQCLPRQVA